MPMGIPADPSIAPYARARGVCLLSALLLLNLIGCQPAKIKAADPKETQPATADANTESSNGRDERVDPPQNIIGSYLHCAIEQEPINSKAEALIGCRLDNAEGQRTPAANFGASYLYGAGVVADSEVSVYSKNLVGDKRYDAAYLFLGPSRSSVLAAARATSLKILIRGSKATGKDIIVGSKFSEAEKPAESFPEPRGDYSAVRDEILTNQSSSVLPSNP